MAKEFFGEDLIPDWLSEGIHPPKSDEQDVLVPHETFYRPSVPDDFVWRPFNLCGGVYGIYTCVVNKLDYLERLIHRTKSHSSKRASAVGRALRRLQDRFQPISLFMDSIDRYDNDSLVRPMATHHGATPMDLFGPRDSLTFGVDELPDIVPHAFFCKYWSKKEAVSPFRAPADLKIASILKKVVPAPCGGRELSKKLTEAWKDGVPGGRKVFDAITRIVFGGLLGVYDDDHCVVEANFCLRRHLYHWHGFSNLTRESFNQFVDDNPRLTMFILREMFFYTVSLCSPLQKAMSKLYYWNSMKMHTFSAMENAVRTVMNDFCVRRSGGVDNQTCFFSGASPLFQSHVASNMLFRVDTDLDVAHKTILTFTPRRVGATFVDKMREELRSVDVEDAARKRVAKRPPRDESIYDRDIKRMNERISDAMELGIALRWEIVLSEEFDVSVANSIEPLHKAQTLYTTETKPTLVPKVLKAILKTSERDYVMIRAFFTRLNFVRGVRIFPLPKNIAEVQRKMFAERLNIDLDLFDLPPMAGNVFVCMNCFRVKTAVVKPGIPRDVAKGVLNSPYDVSYDLFERRSFCGKANIKKPPKKKKKSKGKGGPASLAKKGTMKDTRKDIREEIDRAKAELCRCSEVVPINIMGKALRTERHGVVIFCPTCGRLTSFHRDGFRNGGSYFSCCAKGVIPQVKENPFKCIICNPDKVRREPIKTLRLAMGNDKTVKYEAFCTAHSCEWVDLFPQVLSIATIRFAYINKLTSKEIDAVTHERVFLDPGSRRAFSWKGTKIERMKVYDK